LATLTWLHLSDVHLCDTKYGYQSKPLREKLFADLAKMQEQLALWPDFIFFTGDLAFGHLGEKAGHRMADQYREAQVFLDRVRRSFKPEIPQERLFLVPGNHDVHRGKITPDQRWWLEEKADPTEIEAMIRDADLQWRRIMERLEDYKAFLEQNRYDHLLADPDRLIYHATFAVGNGLSLGIAGLNSAWSCGKDREKGTLWLGALWQMGTVSAPLAAADLRVALSHHPVSWLNTHENPSIDRFFEQDFDFHLHGHEHQGWVLQQLQGFVRIAADATHDHTRSKTRDNGYNFVRLDLLTGAGEVWLRSYEPLGGGWIAKLIADHTDPNGCWRLNPSTRLQEILDRRAAGAAPAAAAATLGRVGAAAAPLVPEPAEAAPVDDWGQAPDVAAFHGRQKDIEQCRQWIESQACKVLGIFGGAGIGKTLFATKVARDVRSHFKFVFWRSLATAPPLPELLQECLLLVTSQQDLEAAMPLDQLFFQLINNFRSARCLMVLDDFDTVLEAGDETGRYRNGYESYGQLITLLGSTPHVSCLLVTSSEEPKEFSVLARADSPVRAHALGNLSANEVRAILQDKGLGGNDDDWRHLTECYSGNPLALKLVSETIAALFSGNIPRFLDSGETLSGDLMDLLEKHFERLAPMEQQICYWLAIAREGSSLEELASDILGQQPLLLRRNIQEAIGSLRGRSLLEEDNVRFSLPNVVAAFLTNKLVATAFDEIANGEPALISAHSLMKGRDKDYSREAQVRLILKPVSDRLLAALGEEGVVAAAGKLLGHDPAKGPGYLGGNVVNLLAQAGIDLTNWVFSGITIRQAYLRGVELHAVDFSYCDLSQSVFTEVLGAVMSVAVSPDRQALAAADLAGVITLWSLADNGKRGTLSGHNGRVWSVCFVDGGKQLASCGIDMTVRLWDLSTMRERTVLTGHTAYVAQLATSADGALLASVSGDRTVRLWSVASGQFLAERLADTRELHAVRFRPGGRTIVLATAGHDGRIRLWDVGEPSKPGQLAEWPAHAEPVYALAFSPDGQLLASGGADRTIRLWRLDEEGEQGPASYRPQLLHTLHGHEGEVSSLAFDADGSILASGSHDYRVKVWSLPKDAAPECRSTLFGHSGGIHSIAFASAKTLVSGGDDLTVRQWDIPSGRSLVTLQGHASWINAVVLSADGDTLATGSDDRVVRLWSIKDGSCRILRDHAGKVTSLAMTADGALLASGCDDGVVRLWDLKNRECIRRFAGHAGAVKSIAIGPGSDLLVSCGLDHTLRIWDLHSAKSRLVLRERFDLTTSAAVNYKGSLIAATCADQRIRVWRLDRGELLQIFIGHADGVKAVAFGPDDLLASGGGDKLVKLWDLATGRSRGALAGHSNQVTSVAFSPDGATIASGSTDTTVRLWDRKTAVFRNSLTGHQAGVHAVAFSGDGLRLVSGSADETAKLWDLEQNRELVTFKNPKLYQGMKITGARGISEAEKASLLALGAVDG